MLKLQFFGHLVWKTLENILMLGKVEGKRRSRWQKKRWLESITDSMDMNLSKLRETVEGIGACVLRSLGSQRAGHDLGAVQQKQYPGNQKRRKPALSTAQNILLTETVSVLSLTRIQSTCIEGNNGEHAEGMLSALLSATNSLGQASCPMKPSRKVWILLCVC